MAVSAAEEAGYPTDDVDRTDFSDPALQSDEVKRATEPHADVETTWIFPESPDSKLHVGGTNDLLVALANAGAKTFNVSHVEGRLLDGAGKLALALPRLEYGQNLGALEQRSFRFPIELDAEMALGEYTLSAKIFYNTRDKAPYVSDVINEAVELTPPLPNAAAQLLMLQMGLGAVGVLALGLVVVKALGAPADAKGGKAGGSAKPKAAAKDDVNEWLSGTLAGTEKRASKKTKLG